MGKAKSLHGGTSGQPSVVVACSWGHGAKANVKHSKNYGMPMLSNITLNDQVKMIVVNSGSQLSEMSIISHKLKSHAMSLSWSLYLYLSLALSLVMSPHHSDQLSQRSQVSRITL